MKIEIDLNDIFGGGDEGPDETLQESIRRQVVDSLIRRVSEGVDKEVRAKVGEAIDVALAAQVEKLMPGLIDQLMHSTYTPVDHYGRKGEPTNFQDQLLAKVIAQMEYKPSGDRYNQDRENVFTKTVREVVATKLAGFKKEFDATIDKTFVAEALEHATAKLRERMGIKG